MKPPLNLQSYVAKVPRHALFVILDGSDVQNPEFVATSKDEYADKFQKWKRTVLPTLKKSVVEFWELHDKEFVKVNLLNR